MKMTFPRALAGLCLACPASLFAEEKKEITPYAVAANQVMLAQPATLKIDPNGIPPPRYFSSSLSKKY